eukprot:1137781-Pelagomonas_calceolata.AAC.1
MGLWTGRILFCGRPLVGKTYIIPASMYGSQIWGTSYMKEGAEMDCPLQTGHLCFLKCVSGAKRPLATGPNLVRKVLKADRALSAVSGVKCWMAGILESFNDLESHEQYTQAVLTGTAIELKEFSIDLRSCLWREWRNWRMFSQGGTAISRPLIMESAA